jgi:hypothetical protein
LKNESNGFVSQRGRLRIVHGKDIKPVDKDLTGAWPF